MTIKKNVATGSELRTVQLPHTGNEETLCSLLECAKVDDVVSCSFSSVMLREAWQFNILDQQRAGLHMVTLRFKIFRASGKTSSELSTAFPPDDQIV